MTVTESTTDNRQGAVRLAVGMSAVSLLLSGWAFFQSLDDNGREREIDERLACLELPGPNDCGLDGQ